MTLRVVPAAILQSLIELALRSRLNLADLFAEAGIDPDIVGRADAVVGVDQIDRLLALVFARARDPWFGLHAGLANQYTSLDIVGRLMATSSTFRDAIQELLRFKDLIVPYLDFVLREGGGEAVLACRPDGSVAVAETRQHNDLVVATMVSVGRALAGAGLQLRALAFRHDEPADIGEYVRSFGDVRLDFSQDGNAVVFAAGVLDQPLTTAYPPYHRRVEAMAEQQLSRLLKGQAVAAQVEGLLEARLGVEPIGIEDIARLFNMTARTLQRRLQVEGVLFGSLRDRVRHRTACRLLADATVDMETLARQLGFSDTANFYHAFRRWEGQTPGAFRRRLATPG